MKKIIPFIALILVSVMLFTACNNNAQTTTDETTLAQTTAETTQAVSYRFEEASDGSTKLVASYTMPVTESTLPKDHKLVKFTMQNGDTFVIETYPEYAPETCANFIALVSEGFYNGTNFHRVIPGFMAQGGGPKADGTSREVEPIYGEFADNGFPQNTLQHKRGVVSMARTPDCNSATSQFFICYDDAGVAHLDRQYAAFGKVVEGMENVDAFLEIPMIGSTPSQPIIIEKAEVIG